MRIGEVVTSVIRLRQGDVIDVTWVPQIVEDELRREQAPCGVVIISQTCDVVQISPSKKHLIVAPIIEAPEANLLSNARRGRSPLKLFLKGAGNGGKDVIADLQHAVSVPKDFVLGAKLLGRISNSSHAQEARNLSMAIGRAFARFAFPDEVQLSLSKFLKKTRDKAGNNGAVGRVLSWVDILRVSADQWDRPGRRLKIYAIIPARLLILPEDADPGWTWEQVSHTSGTGADFRQRDLNSVSGILADYCEKLDQDAQSVNLTTLLRLWELWIDKVRYELLEPSIDDEVSSFEVELLSDEEFTYAKWKRTESLDLEDLSDSTLPVQE